MVDRCRICGGNGDECFFIQENYTLEYTEIGNVNRPDWCFLYRTGTTIGDINS